MNGSNDNKAQADQPIEKPLFPKVKAPLYGGCCDTGMRFGLFDNGDNKLLNLAAVLNEVEPNKAQLPTGYKSASKK